MNSNKKQINNEEKMEKKPTIKKGSLYSRQSPCRSLGNPNPVINCGDVACQVYVVEEVHEIEEAEFNEMVKNANGGEFPNSPDIQKSLNEIEIFCQSDCTNNRVKLTTGGDDLILVQGPNRDPNNYSTLSIAFFKGLLRLHPEFEVVDFYRIPEINDKGMPILKLAFQAKKRNVVIYCGDITEAYPISGDHK
jgi:hypothetical protein